MKHQVESHLTEVHNGDPSVAHTPVSDSPISACELDDPSKTTPSLSQALSFSYFPVEEVDAKHPVHDVEPRADQSPLGAHSSTLSPPAVDVTSSDSPTAPNSPLSPLSREELGNARKRIIITLSTSPVSTSQLISSLPTSHSDLDPPNTHATPEVPHRRSEGLTDTENSVKSVHCHSLKSDELVTRESPVTAFQGSISGEHKNSDYSLGSIGMQSERPQVVCDFCGRTFCSKQACELHARTHKNERKFPCSFCHVSFSQMTSLKRHIVAIHGIVPEPTYLDNSDDKDFELNEELDSDSDDSSDIKPSRRYSQTRRHRVCQHRRSDACGAPRPRGRPKRSSELFIPTLDRSDPLRQIHPIPVHCSGDELSAVEQHAEIRYRTILPRPAHGEPVGTVKRITVSRPKRNKRPRRIPRKSYSDENKAILTPMLCDTLARKATSLTSDALGYPPGTVIYLDQNGILSNFVTIESQQALACHVQQQQSASQQSDTPQLDDPASSAKPAHVLTVAAAYASQLPSVNCATSLVDDRTNDHQSDCNPNADSTNVGSVSLVSVPQGSVIPGIQIYPSPWLSVQQQQHTLSVDHVPLDSAVVSQSVVDSRSDTNVSDYVECAFSLASMAAMPQSHQPIQIYPVIGSDGQTTLYYMATLADPQDPTNPSITVAPAEPYYAQYSHSEVNWPPVSISDSVSDGQPDMTNKDDPSSMNLSSTGGVFECNPNLSLNTVDALQSSRLHSGSAANAPCTDGNVTVSGSFLSDVMDSHQHLSYSSSHGISLYGPGEAIEVIDLDASKFASSSIPVRSMDSDLITDPYVDREPNAIKEEASTHASGCIDAPVHSEDLPRPPNSSSPFLSTNLSDCAVTKLDSPHPVCENRCPTPVLDDASINTNSTQVLYSCLCASSQRQPSLCSGSPQPASPSSGGPD